MQMPRFFGFEEMCATFIRGMAQDAMFDRVELAEPYFIEYSWSAVPLNRNIRKNIQNKEIEP